MIGLRECSFQIYVINQQPAEKSFQKYCFSPHLMNSTNSTTGSACLQWRPYTKHRFSSESKACENYLALGKDVFFLHLSIWKAQLWYFCRNALWQMLSKELEYNFGLYDVTLVISYHCGWVIRSSNTMVLWLKLIRIIVKKIKYSKSYVCIILPDLANLNETLCRLVKEVTNETLRRLVKEVINETLRRLVKEVINETLRRLVKEVINETLCRLVKEVINETLCRLVKEVIRELERRKSIYRSKRFY